MLNLSNFINEAIKITKAEDIDSILDSFSEIKNKTVLNNTIISAVISSFKGASDEEIIKFLDWIKKNKIKITPTEEELSQFVKNIMTPLSKAKYNKVVDLNFIDISKATNLTYLFPHCCKCSINVSKWNTSKVKNMYGLFGKFKGDIIGLEKWNVSNVTNMMALFSGCEEFSSDISKWDVSNVTSMASMFSNGKFNQDISKWDVSGVIDMQYMFANNKIFNQDISKWDLSSLTQCNNMFYGCPKFKQDLSNWDMNGIITYSMFEDSVMEKSPEKLPSNLNK